MATLESPGVMITVIDESFYTPAAPGTIPLIFVATEQDKINPSGLIAQGTTAENAGKVWLITSQRDLTDTFGTPKFYTDNSGNSLHGNELNEYGLQAAYSALGVSSRAYIVRADIDLQQLTPSSSPLEGDPVSGTYWLNTGLTKWGIKEWTTGLKFVDKTPIVLDDDSPPSQVNLLSDPPSPTSAVGNKGDYAVVAITNENIGYFYKNSLNNWEVISDFFDGGKRVIIGPHYNYPTFDSGTPLGSVWIVTTTPSNGSDWYVQYYNGSARSWIRVSAPIYDNPAKASYELDRTNGGSSISVGSIFVQPNDTMSGSPSVRNKIWRRQNSGETIVTSNASTVISTGTYSFFISESAGGTFGPNIRINITSAGGQLGSLVPALISASTLTNVSASWDEVNNKLTIKHGKGGEMLFTESTNNPLSIIGFNLSSINNLYAAPSATSANFHASNWKSLSFVATKMAPTTDPVDGTMWYSSIIDEVDILYHNGTTWVGYKDSTAFPTSDPGGPIISATEPDELTGQSDGTPLITGDIWIDTSDLETYGKKIYVYKATNPAGQRWELQDVTDQSTPNGWLFADARWATTSTSAAASTIASLLSSNFLDPDAPDPALYPKGMRLWNTRRSGFNVKKFVTGYINITANEGLNLRYRNESMANYTVKDRWVSQNNVEDDGSGVFGRKAQRKQVVETLKSTIGTNSAIRDTDTLNFNLILSPGYHETIQDMVNLNTDRGITAFVIGDTPFRLKPTGSSLNSYGLNTNGSLDNNDSGAVTYDEYMAMYYPSGYSTDNAGNNIVVPPSHMMLRTFINSDAKSYQWFAPAGTRRGGVDNASSVGYIDAEGEFRSVALHQGLRDVLDDVKINPIATLTGVGILAYGQRTRARNASALDRINVSRLVCYLRRQLDILARPFLFEPNDAQTRREIKAAAESLMLELVGQRALYDFIVVCDETNNTPARIDRSELYMDIAIEPVKAVEFIYIPLRLKNTGDIAAGL